jgi:hypothetical protein
VTASAQINAPTLRILELQGAPGGFDGAVKVSAFTARASVVSGYTLLTPDVTTGTTNRQVQLWDGAGYRTVTVAAGTAVDTTASATFVIGDHVVSYASRVQSQPSTYSTAGASPRRDATAQHPSVLVITVDVTITSSTLVETPSTTIAAETTTTTTIPATTTTTTPDSTTSTTPASTTSTTPVTTTTVPPTPLMTDSFTIVFDYGRVSAHDTWLAQAP